MPACRLRTSCGHALWCLNSDGIASEVRDSFYVSVFGGVILFTFNCPLREKLQNEFQAQIMGSMQCELGVSRTLRRSFRSSTWRPGYAATGDKF